MNYRHKIGKKIGVIGAGSWGTTLADLLAKKGLDVALWAYEPELADEMGRTGVNSLFLPGISLSPTLKFSHNLRDVVAGKDLLLFVVPSQVLRSVLVESLETLTESVQDTTIVSATKGIELNSLMLVSQIFQHLLPSHLFDNFALLSGPSFAREVAQEMPTAVVTASLKDAVAKRVQAVFSTSCFRVYTNDDVVGVELGGAIKNVIAIAAGIADGLGFGNNTRAALITRGLAEMCRLGLAMGAKSATFSGLAGMGDLVLTCTGDLSRNRTVGVKLGKGQKLQEILGEMRMVAEGVKTTESTVMLAHTLGVEMPIAEAVYRILHEEKPAREAVIELMSRDLKAEGM